jgi:pimeloyl-ACP methyl ester carboxylesterase
VRRVLVGLAVLVLLGAGAGAAFTIISGGSDDGSDDGEPATHKPSPSAAPGALPPSDPKLADFYDQKLDWQPCHDGDDDECATMKVPLDYAHPQGESINLALLKVLAREPDSKVGSLVVNPGGPGAPGTSYAAAGDTYWGDALLDHFDIVGFDPRGTGDSTSVDCLTDEQLDDYLASDPVPDSSAELAEFENGARAFSEGCLTNSGALAAHVSTVEAARDMDVLRALLGEPSLDFFGASYGTKLGATYAQIFPTRVGRMVLDGAVDLALDHRDTAIQQAAGFETALRAYVGNCVDSGDCFLGDSVDAGIARIQQLLADLEATPLPAQDDRKLTAGNAFYGIAAPLYDRKYWNVLSLSLRQAFGGDGSTLLLLSDSYATRNPDGSYATNLLEANWDINCLDDPTSIPISKVVDVIPAFEKAAPTFGDAFAYPLANCSGFTPRSTQPVPHNKARGAPPLLVIGTTRDPATPLRWAVALADQLASAVLVTRDGDGHTGYHSDNSCVDATVEDYLVDGTVPSADVDCPAP